MSAHSTLHFCLIGMKQPPDVEGRAHPRLADTIEVTARIGDASFTVSGETAEVRSVLAELHAAALRIEPLSAAAVARAQEAP